jgi:hypothetical protein
VGAIDAWDVFDARNLTRISRSFTVLYAKITSRAHVPVAIVSRPWFEPIDVPIMSL